LQGARLANFPNCAINKTKARAQATFLLHSCTENLKPLRRKYWGITDAATETSEN
jgi:hypothetical protein